MIQFTSPFTLKASPIKAAHLEAKLSAYDHTPSVYTLTIVNGTGANAGTVTLTAPAMVCGGVYRLRLTGLDGKCCYSGLVYTTGCPPVTIPGTYSGDGGVIPPVPSCP